MFARPVNIIDYRRQKQYSLTVHRHGTGDRCSRLCSRCFAHGMQSARTGSGCPHGTSTGAVLGWAAPAANPLPRVLAAVARTLLHVDHVGANEHQGAAVREAWRPSGRARQACQRFAACPAALAAAHPPQLCAHPCGGSGAQLCGCTAAAGKLRCCVAEGRGMKGGLPVPLSRATLEGQHDACCQRDARAGPVPREAEAAIRAGGGMQRYGGGGGAGRAHVASRRQGGRQRLMRRPCAPALGPCCGCLSPSTTPATRPKCRRSVL